MNSIVIIAGLVCLIILLFLIGAPMTFIRLLGKVMFKITVGILFLFIFNVFAGYIGLHLPINIFTVIVSSLLGILGIISLLGLQILFLS